MDPTAILREEHEVILRVLASLECLADEAKRERKLDAVSAGQALDFLRTFADDLHHGREEDLLFPRMREHGAGAPVSVMLQEHEAGRALVRSMAAALQAHDVDAFVRSAGEFIPLLQHHIIKENMILFPMAEHLLPKEVMAEVAEKFEAAERERAPETRERMLGIAARLCARMEA